MWKHPIDDWKNVDFALLLQECSTFGGTDMLEAWPTVRPSCCIQVSALGSVVFQTRFRPSIGRHVLANFPTVVFFIFDPWISGAGVNIV
jgi:hypothetical protein